MDPTRNKIKLYTMKFIALIQYKSERDKKKTKFEYIKKKQSQTSDTHSPRTSIIYHYRETIIFAYVTTS